MAPASFSSSDIQNSLEAACSDGEGISCALLGHAYAKDNGVKQSFQKSREYYEKDCSDLKALLEFRREKKYWRKEVRYKSVAIRPKARDSNVQDEKQRRMEILHKGETFKR